MPRQVLFGLLVEGNSDKKFLPALITRLADQLLASQFDILDPAIIEFEEEPKRQANKIFKAAELAVGFDLLIVHADCDKPSPEETYEQRIKPGFAKVEKARAAGKPVCSQLIALIPKRMIEAWIIADIHTLLEVIGTNKNLEELGLQYNLGRVEEISDPKNLLVVIVRKALAENTQRRRNTANVVNDLYSEMGQKISLELLAQLPSFRQFKTNLEEAFTRLGLLR